MILTDKHAPDKKSNVVSRYLLYFYFTNEIEKLYSISGGSETDDTHQSFSFCKCIYGIGAFFSELRLICIKQKSLVGSCSILGTSFALIPQ